jgi:hypothetical protein
MIVIIDDLPFYNYIKDIKLLKFMYPSPNPLPCFARKGALLILNYLTLGKDVEFLNMSKSRRFDFYVIKKHAQELRKNMTESEKLLWNELRGKKVSGYRFLRQHPGII